MQLAIFAALLLSFASTSLAYLVNVPNDNQGWHAYGGQPIKWSRVDTDAQRFAVVLTNQDRSVLGQDIILARDVDGTKLSTYVYPPTRHGFPTGGHFRVNLVKSEHEPNTIFAQSNEFTISK